jgi:hypothetical protein
VSRGRSTVADATQHAAEIGPLCGGRSHQPGRASQALPKTADVSLSLATSPEIPVIQSGRGSLSHLPRTSYRVITQRRSSSHPSGRRRRRAAICPQTPEGHSHPPAGADRGCATASAQVTRSTCGWPGLEDSAGQAAATVLYPFTELHALPATGRAARVGLVDQSIRPAGPHPAGITQGDESDVST